MWPANTSRALYRQLLVNAFHNVGSGVMRQLVSATQRGGLRSADGGTAYFAKLAGVTTPVLALAGSRDRQCPPDAAEATVTVLGEAATLRVFGPEAGEAEHYGHFDMVIGERAREEVWPEIVEWLVSHD